MTAARRTALVLCLTGAAAGCASRSAAGGGGGGTSAANSVWVCHGNKNPKWQRVAAAAGPAHRRHGDSVTEAAQVAGEACS